MSDESWEHRVRVALGKAFHHRHHNPEGAVDLEHIAREQGVSEDQVKEQMAYLREQNLLVGPLASEGQQVSGVPSHTFADQHQLSDAGFAWVSAGFPIV